MMNSDNHTRNRLPRDATEPAIIDRGRQIDRLVGGDLAESERQELLAWLDAEPVRWRRCGRAFLESQVWRQALAELEAEGMAETPARAVSLPVVVPPKISRQDSLRRMWRPAVNAAVVICMFGCGWLAAQLANGRADSGVNPIASNPRSDGGQSGVTQKGSAGPLNAAGKLATRVVLEERPMDCEFTLPMLGAGLPAEHWARQASVPSYVKSRWGSQGYQVSEKRQFVPMELADGRRVVVPINHVTLTYVGQHLL